MDDLELIKKEFEDKCNDLEKSLDVLKERFDYKIEEIKNNEILRAISDLGVRLSAIEERFKNEDKLKAEADD